MIDLKTGAGIILPKVAKKTKHQDYPHVVEYAESYSMPLSTGNNIEPLIHRFNRRETQEERDQRARLYVATSPAVINTVMGPVRKIAKVKPNVNRVEFGPERKLDTEKLQAVGNKFYAGKDVKHFLGSVGFDAGAIDPNSFCLISFDKFDGRYETPRAYPTIIGCKDAWNFEYFNGELQWLLVHRDIKYVEEQEKERTKKNAATAAPPVEVGGNYFCAYLDDHHMVFTQVDRRKITSKVEGILIDNRGVAVKGFEPGSTTQPNPAFAVHDRYYFRVSESELYEVVFYHHKSGRVQAFRMGYKLDLRTEGRTCVSLWHAAMPYLLKGIKSGSELDISASLHAFLKEYSFGPRCPGYVEGTGKDRIELDCNMGQDPGGKRCKRCGGTGMFRIESGMDHVVLPLPPRGVELPDLSKMHHYAELPVETLKWQDEYKTKMDKLCYEAVYNTEPMSRDQIQPTATGEIKDNETLYDTLAPGCSWFAESHILIYDLLAVYTFSDLGGFVNQYQFPRNLRFESIGDLVALMKALKEAGASLALIIQVQKDIMDLLFVDDEQALKRAKTMLEYDPFAGKDEGTNLALVSQDLATKFDKVFWTNMPKVFNEAEFRCAHPTEGPPVDFYELAEKKQRELIEKIVQEILDELEEQAEETAAKLTIGVEGAGDVDPAGGEGEQPPSKKPDPALPTSKDNGTA